MNTQNTNACERCARCREGRFAMCKNASRLAEAAAATLPFVAFAFSEGVHGAETAGRNLEAALETTGERWEGWATQYPGKMPKLWGDKHIAEANFYPEEGQRMFFLREVP